MMTVSASKVYGYVRVSTAQQVDEGHSLEAQQKAVEDYCRRVLPDVQMAGCYVDRLSPKGRKKGCSGKTLFKDRPAGGQLAAALKPGDHVVMLDMARGFRRIVDAITTVEGWIEAGVSLHLIRDNIDTTKPAARMLVRLLAVFAQWEREMISERTREVLAFRKAQGAIPPGPAGYGHHFEGKKGHRRRVVNEAEMTVMARIHALSEGGMVYKDIYFLFKAEGVKTRKGAEWSLMRIWRSHKAYAALLSARATDAASA